MPVRRAIARATLLLSLITGAAAPAHAAIFTVSSTLDEVDRTPGDGACRSNPSFACTLRAAIMEHNALGGSNTIVLPAGTYTLTIPGAGESQSAAGSLDVTAGTLTIEGAGAATTIIDGNGLDGVMTLCEDFCAPNTNLQMSGVTVRNAGPGTGFTPPSYTGITVRNGASLVLLDSIVKDNTLQGVYGYPGNLTIDGCTVTNSGIGIDNDFIGGSAQVVVSNSAISGNRQGIRSNGGLLTVLNTTVSNNTPDGGIEVFSSDAKIDSSTISGNTNGFNGGGISIVYSPSTVTVTNTTVTGNIAGDKAGNPAFGGGIYVQGGGGPGEVILTLNNATIANNTAGSASFPSSSFGGGFGLCGDGSVTEVHMSNTILAANTDLGGASAPDYLCCSGLGFAVTEHGYNLFIPGHPATCDFAGDPTGDVFASPLLGGLASNGGPTGAVTLTQRLLPGSPAIDAGNPNAPGSGPFTCAKADQRGVSRPLGAACDIGAYERTACASDSDQDGICNASDTCALFNPDANDLDGDGTPDLCDACPGDSTDSCGAGGGIAQTIGSAGGGLSLGNVSVDVPPSAVSSSRSFSITNLGSSGYDLGTSLSNLLTLVRLGPEGTSFAPQKVAVTFGWPDTFTNDGNLILFKNGNRIGTCYSDASILCSCTPPACASIADCPGVGQCVVKNCGAQGCPTGSASCCDVGQNRWTIQTSSFSEFVFGAECAPTSVTHLTISRVNPPDGNEAFVFKGTFELGSLTLSDLDPVLHGLGLFLSDGNIAHEINATLLPGEYDPQTKQGWKVNPQGRQWTLVSVPSSGSPLPWGIKRVVLHELSPRQPGVVSFLIRGSQFPYPTTLPVEARVSLPGPGTCYSPGFGGSPPAPRCSINPRGTTLTCK